MKKLLFAFCFIFSFAAQAQYIFKVTPKTFEDEIGQSRTIIGIQARILGPIDVSLLSNNIERSFYIAFQLSDSTMYGGRNASTSQFIERAVTNGIAQATAEANIKAIVQALEFGTRSQKYLAAKQLALIYGHTLKDEEEQP